MITTCRSLFRSATAVSAVVVLATGSSCDGCKGEDADERSVIRRADPAEKAELPVKPHAVGQARGVADEELASIIVRTVTGEVTVIPRNGEAERPAREGDDIRSGGALFVPADGAATVAIREVGRFSLAPSSVLIVPKHLRCGVVLLEGAASTTGTVRVSPEGRCYLHTVAGAFCYQQATAVAAVAASGRARLAATEGSIRIAAPAGESLELSEGTMITLDPRKGPTGNAEPFAQESVPDERAFDQWRREERFGGGPQARWMTDEAGRLTERLALDVERLAELMELNREASEHRRKLSRRAGAAAGELEELTGRLARQAEEMVELKEKGMLLAGRIAALTEAVRRHAPDAEAERLASLRARLDKLAADLPPLFERRRKPLIKMKEMLQSTIKGGKAVR